jgi:uncharacterized protein YfaQ (DUF2300 family)
MQAYVNSSAALREGAMAAADRISCIPEHTYYILSQPPAKALTRPRRYHRFVQISYADLIVLRKAAPSSPLTVLPKVRGALVKLVHVKQAYCYN